LDGEDYVTLYGGEAVYADGRVLSRVRSGGYGYTLKRNIAYAYLPSELSTVGTRLEVEIFDQRLGAEVMPIVLFDPNNGRLRA